MLFRSAWACAVLVVFCGNGLAAEKNVVLVVVDDLGLDLACYGNTAIAMPNLDRIAADGTVFTHAYCSTASCSPSRSVILSGMHNHANGMYGLSHAEHHFRSFDRIHSLSTRLSKAGYRTARVGKYHVEPEAAYPFDEALPGNARNGVQMAENCRAFVGAKDERPFFLLYCTSDPHRSGKVGPAPYRPNLFGNESNYPGMKERRYDPQEVVVPPFLPDTPTCRAELAEYYQSASRADQGIGRLVRVLQDTGRWDDTLFIFISDNGIPFPGAKTTVYEPGLRLPCLVRNPYVSKRGVRSEAMIAFVDLAPTILEFAGAEATGPQLHGRSFLSILDQESPSGWDEVYASHSFHQITMYYPMRVVRTRRHKLIWNIAHGLPFPSARDLYNSATWQEALAKGPDSYFGKRTFAAYLHRPEFELYDLENDPDEVVNLADDSQHAELLADLKAKLRAFQERTGDPWAHKWEYE